MDFSSYYRPNLILLSCMGLSPYHTQRARYILCTLFSPFIVSPTIFQLASFITKEYNVNLLLNVLLLNGPIMFYVIKYYNIFINNNKMKALMERVRDDWDSLKEEKEFEIMRKSVNVGRIGTLVSIIFVYSVVLVFMLVYLSPVILNIVAPLNESRQIKQLPLVMEYFIDPEVYIYLIILYLFAISCIAVTTLLGTETLHLMFVQHLCAMFRITSYRIERTVNENQGRSLVDATKEYSGHKSIVEAIDCHRRAIEFNDSYKSINMVYLIPIPFGITALSICLFRFCEHVMTKDIGAASMSFVYILLHFSYILFVNFISQQVIDKSGDVFKKICSSQWYATPLRMQRCLLMMLCKSMKNSSITIGYMYVSSLEGFAMLTSMCLSYFTVIYSTRQS